MNKREKYQECIDEAKQEMFFAIQKYWQRMAYGERKGEHDVYSKYKEDILEDVAQEISQSVFDASDGWIRFDENTVDIVDQSGEN